MHIFAYYLIGKLIFRSFNSILCFIGLTPNVISYFKVDPRLCEVNEKLSLKSRWKKYFYYSSICFHKIEIINLTEIYYFICYFSYLTLLCALTKCHSLTGSLNWAPNLAKDHSLIDNFSGSFRTLKFSFAKTA